MKNTKKKYEGKYINFNGAFYLIESITSYGDDLLLNLIHEGKKAKKKINKNDKNVKLKDLDDIEMGELKWKMPEDLLKKSPDQVAKYMMENSKDMDEAKKRLSFYQDRSNDEDKNKIKEVKMLLSKQNIESDKNSLTAEDLKDFIDNNRDLPVMEILRGLRAMIYSDKDDNMPVDEPIDSTDGDLSK